MLPVGSLARKCNAIKAITTTFSLECGSTARWLLRGVGNRADTGFNRYATAFGLGTTERGGKIGEYLLSLIDGLAGGAVGSPTTSLDDGARRERASVAGQLP